MLKIFIRYALNASMIFVYFQKYGIYLMDRNHISHYPETNKLD